REELQLETKQLPLARGAVLGATRRAIERRREVHVPATAEPALADHDLLVVPIEVREELAGLRVVDLGADRNLHDRVRARGAVLVFSATVLAALAADAPSVAEVEQGGEAVVGVEHDVAAVAAVS